MTISTESLFLKLENVKKFFLRLCLKPPPCALMTWQFLQVSFPVNNSIVPWYSLYTFFPPMSMMVLTTRTTLLNGFSSIDTVSISNYNHIRKVMTNKCLLLLDLLSNTDCQNLLQLSTFTFTRPPVEGNILQNGDFESGNLLECL